MQKQDLQKQDLTPYSANDSIYYAQVLSQFSPVTISVERYGDLSVAEKAMFAEHNPSQDDYRVTLSSSLVSRFKLGQRPEDKAAGKKLDLRLGIQELEYTHSTMQTSAGQVDEYHLTRNTPLKRVKTWVAIPVENAVHFLVERNLDGGETKTFGRSERRTISLRVVLQAHIETEVGPVSFPVPVLDHYEPFKASRHGELPDKRAGILNPFDNEPEPYWVIKEVAV